MRTLALFLGLAFSASAAHMTVSVTDNGNVAVTNCKVVLTITGGGQTNSTNFVTTLPKTNTTDTAGLATFSNIVAAPYIMTIYSTKFGTTYNLLVTNQTAGFFSATECTPSVTDMNALAPYSQAASDLRFAPKSSPQVTNLVVWGSITSSNLLAMLRSMTNGITTNLQVQIPGSLTNNLFFTNGILKRVLGQ